MGIALPLVESTLDSAQLDGSQPLTFGSSGSDRAPAGNAAERIRYLTSTKTLFECRVRPYCALLVVKR